MNKFEQEFPVVAIFPIKRLDDNLKTIGLVLNSKIKAESFYDLLHCEAHSFYFETNKLNNVSSLVLKFYNSDLEHHFSLNYPISEYVNPPDSFYIQIIFQEIANGNADEIGLPFKQSFQNYN